MGIENPLPSPRPSEPTPVAATISLLSTVRPGLYVLIILCALPAALAYRLRTTGAFACSTGAPGGDDYIAYCDASGYGDYDRGAFWFGLEPRIRSNAAAADVLFLGSSRMQFAFSAKVTADWFSAARARYYLLGFSHTENLTFTRPLLADLRPRARAYVINVDQFFDDRETGPTQRLLHDKEVLSRYQEKKFWQSLQGALCGVVPSLCGKLRTFRRSREQGAWELRGVNAIEGTPIGEGPSKDREQWSRHEALAREFVSHLPVDRRCVILTIAPSRETMIDEARAIAASLGLPLVSPAVEGLRTIDGSHLDRQSAERWSAAFFEAAGAQLNACMGSANSP